MIETSTNATELKRLSYELVLAWKDRNHEFLNDIVSDAFTLVSPLFKGTFFSKEEWMKMIMETYRLEEFEFHILRIMDFQDCVVVSSQIIFLASPSYSGIAQEYLILDVWRQEDLKWKLICRQPTFIRQAE
ncbi:MAG: hypothetical protein C5B52_14470 [Bacteroidetes bacterium]|nr:MAG: hypothetical protein C5B52_14470 [Bacteroidota bacterium]